MVTVRTFLSVTVTKKWELRQMYVHNAFVHEELNEEVYMRLPIGFVARGKHTTIWLKKSLYGSVASSTVLAHKISKGLVRMSTPNSLILKMRPRKGKNKIYNLKKESTLYSGALMREGRTILEIHFMDFVLSAFLLADTYENFNKVKNLWKLFKKGNRFERENRFGNGGDRFDRGHGNRSKYVGSTSGKHNYYDCSSKNHFVDDFSKAKMKKVFVDGAWSDSEDGDQMEKDATCLMAIDLQKFEHEYEHVVMNLTSLE
uniref:Retrovirus-related Pol polyprotein from transposon TNT 1-94 n=1 Tax=Tanacetum cinerariifolium TaxID=118510 RepID=A0A6L2N8V5_TANCI|nr:retrovirus-related Pol polyprotein from transposon TNT 1-94 [Tanacetum cinerariifolium]